MADGWTYSGLRPIQRGAPHRLLQELFDQLFRWSKDVTERHEEFPAGFTEWTMAGHFAVAASQPPLRYFPFQDYNVRLTNTPKTKGKGKGATKRPDLHLRQEGWRNSCIFEFKRQSISLAATAGRDLAGSTFKSMKAAYSQLTQVANGSDDWARYLCPTVGMTVWLNYMVNGRDHWASKWQYEECYVQAWDQLLYERVTPALQARAEDFENFGRLYYCGYRMPHSLVDTHHSWREEEWTDRSASDGRGPRTFPVGMVWVVAAKEWPSA